MDIDTVKGMKGKEKISVLTCYDYSFAKAIDGKVDIILVGDSLGNVVLGYERTKHVTLADMIRHLGAVRRGVKESLLVCDLPFGSYDTTTDAIKNAKALIDTGADGVKPEGRPEIVRALVDCGIPVMGHVGLLPQTAEKPGIVGKNEEDAQAITTLAKEIAAAGAFCVVIECVPSGLAKEITDSVSVPTIGIGAGECDGQVLVLYDLLGLFPDFAPKFARKYMDLQEEISKAVFSYSMDVKKGNFPGDR
jgi:3-methyl-2-oxobutanoate hydroxymethyltransferase